MSFALGLLQDLRDQEILRHRHATVAGTPELEPGLRRQFALLRRELARLGVLVATATSIANRCVAQPSLATSATAASWLQLDLSDRARTAATALDVAAATGPDIADDLFELTALWDDLVARLTLARSLARSLGRLATPGAISQPANTAFVGDDAIADAWQRVCQAMLALADELEALGQAHGEARVPPHEAATRELLRRAGEGRSPCIDLDGKLSIPGWAERRADPRVDLNLPATLRFGGNAYPTRVSNLSRRGMGITFARPLPTGTDLEVRLGDGRAFRAVVQWSKLGRVGLALQAPLAADDPLLTGA
jgi:hypothetical protein